MTLLAPAALGGQTPFDSLHFRSIGPAAMGGRIDDVEGVPGDPLTVYVATASGGLWKTTNKGTTWSSIFDGQGVATFGDVAIFEGNPNILYVGTGEQNNRQSSSWGDGVYKSTDAGKTWTHLGLERTRHIGRIAIHPSNPDIAWVAAAGNLWSASTERGIYRTTDGGRSWTRTLYVDSLTGATDVVVNPRDPNLLVAAMYQRLRTPSGFNGGGPGAGSIVRPMAASRGAPITAGIPEGDKGRIGLAIARSDPRILVATIEHATAGGTYRSEDGGETWTRVNALNPRPMYYSSPVIDPTDANRIWMPGATMYRSDDGGRTFKTLPTGPTYDVGLKGDHHAVWVDPRDPRHVYLGGDGGLHETWDLGITWVRINNLPIGQFYSVAVDDREPYWIYGGMQDNHSWMGPSATRHWLGIVNEDWRQIGFGDGMYQRPDPFNPRRVYTASQNLAMQRFDIETGDRLGLKPFPPAEGDSAYRFDWTAPIIVSRHTPGTLYVGGNRLFISHDAGNSWKRTPDLTRQVNRDTIAVMGVRGRDIKLSRNDGESSFSELSTISESPLDAQVLWVGSDDGLVQVSRRRRGDVDQRDRGDPRRSDRNVREPGARLRARARRGVRELRRSPERRPDDLPLPHHGLRQDVDAGNGKPPRGHAGADRVRVSRQAACSFRRARVRALPLGRLRADLGARGLAPHHPLRRPPRPPAHEGHRRGDARSLDLDPRRRSPDRRLDTGDRRRAGASLRRARRHALPVLGRLLVSRTGCLCRRESAGRGDHLVHARQASDESHGDDHRPGWTGRARARGTERPRRHPAGELGPAASSATTGRARGRRRRSAGGTPATDARDR